jgi:hypothetical protein
MGAVIAQLIAHWIVNRDVQGSNAKMLWMTASPDEYGWLHYHLNQIATEVPYAPDSENGI